MSLLIKAVLVVLGANVVLILLLFLWMLWSRYGKGSRPEELEPPRDPVVRDASAKYCSERPVKAAKRAGDTGPRR